MQSNIFENITLSKQQLSINKLPVILPLVTAQIDVWYFSLLNNYTDNFLNYAEQQRAKCFYLDKHRNRFTSARSMLRLIIAN